jgi:hypothetical protein
MCLLHVLTSTKLSPRGLMFMPRWITECSVIHRDGSPSIHWFTMADRWVFSDSPWRIAEYSVIHRGGSLSIQWFTVADPWVFGDSPWRITEYSVIHRGGSLSIRWFTVADHWVFSDSSCHSSWEATSHLASQEIPAILWKTNVHYHM